MLLQYIILKYAHDLEVGRDPNIFVKLKENPGGVLHMKQVLFVNFPALLAMLSL